MARPALRRLDSKQFHYGDGERGETIIDIQNDKGKNSKIRVTNALVNKHLNSINLLSVGTLDQSGHTVVFGNGKCKIYTGFATRHEACIAIGVLNESNVYVLAGAERVRPACMTTQRKSEGKESTIHGGNMVSPLRSGCEFYTKGSYLAKSENRKARYDVDWPKLGSVVPKDVESQAVSDRRSAQTSMEAGDMTTNSDDGWVVTKRGKSRGNVKCSSTLSSDNALLSNPYQPLFDASECGTFSRSPWQNYRGGHVEIENSTRSNQSCE